MRIRIVKFLVLAIALGMILSCSNNQCLDNTNNETNNTNIATANVKLSATPELSTETIDDNEGTRSKYQNELYTRKRIISKTIDSITELNSQYYNEPLSEEQHEKRKQKIFNVVDKFINEIDSADDNRLNDINDFVALAKLCRIFEEHHHGLSQRTSSYNIAFFYIVKKSAAKYKDDASAMEKLHRVKELYIFNGMEAVDFLRSVEGKEPSYLYHEEPDELPDGL